MTSPTFNDEENVGKPLFRAVPGSSAEMGVHQEQAVPKQNLST